MHLYRKPGVMHLHRKLGGLDTLEGFNVRLQCGLDPLLGELVHLLWRAAHKRLGVQQRVELVPDGLEVFVLPDPLNEVVLATLLLDHCSRLVREHTNLLVALLSVTPGLDDGHDDVFGSHEGQLLTDTSGDHRGVHDHALGDVLQSGQQDVGGEERLGNGNTTIGAA
jgi:hypothetical protein